MGIDVSKLPHMPVLAAALLGAIGGSAHYCDSEGGTECLFL